MLPRMYEARAQRPETKSNYEPDNYLKRQKQERPGTGVRAINKATLSRCEMSKKIKSLATAATDREVEGS